MNQTQTQPPNSTLQTLRKVTFEGATHHAGVPVQITSRTEGRTRDGQPFYEIVVADATGSEKLRLWNDTEAFRLLEGYPQMGKGTALLLAGRWKQNQYGLNLEGAQARSLTAEEMNTLFAGDAGFLARNEAAWEYIRHVFNVGPFDPMHPLALVCQRLLSRVEDPMRRAAAARAHHHARRGGLVEHTAGMLRTARAVSACYREIEPMVLMAGVLFHDVGKIFETGYQECGFNLEMTQQGALMGHIAIGARLLEGLWRDCHGEQWSELRDHVCHCILSHHGQKEWGSPVEPATPEAVALHQVDMIDSRMDKLRTAYLLPETAPGVIDTRFGNMVKPFKTSATYARMIVASMLEEARRTDESTDLRQHFCELLVQAGITTKQMEFEALPRSVLETAFRRWDELQTLLPDLADLPESLLIAK